jgi:diaminopimelate decarboxylase
VPFDDPAKGDILVFMNCGAYSVTDGMALFLSREMPQIQAYSEKDGPVLLRDTIETDRFNCRM